MKEKLTFSNVVLAVAGMIGVAIGSGVLFAPVAFQASAGIRLGDDPGLLSEMRGPGGVILMSGLLMLGGCFLRTLKPTSLILAALLYGGYGVARLLSLVVDGTPSATIIVAMEVEFVICAAALVALVRLQMVRVQGQQV